MSNQYKLLADFLKNKMRMSHIYQPVMLMELLSNKGNASVEDIAKHNPNSHLFKTYCNPKIMYFLYFFYLIKTVFYAVDFKRIK